MIIPQSTRNEIGLVHEIPKKLLIEKVIGERIDARVMQADRATGMITVRVAERILQLRTSADLQSGQKIQLEWVEQAGKSALKLVLPSETVQNPSLKLQVGQQLPVEIVKLLSQGRVLVQMLSAHKTLFDIDISQLSKQFNVGDKLMMAIISLTPLQIQLQAESRQQKIVNRLQQLLSQQIVNPNLKGMTESLRYKSISEPMQLAITNLIQSSLDKTTVTQPNILKQAMELSGTFSENKLLNQPNRSQQDFKTNLAKVMAAIETAISQVRSSDGEGKLNNLPGQVLSALASQGKTVEQLLHVLLSGKSTVSANAIQTLLPGLLNKEQALLLSKILSNTVLTNTGATGIGRLVPVDLAELMLLFKEVATVYNKVTLNQLLMLREADSNTSSTTSWLLELPIKDQDNLDLLHMQIDQHKQKGEEEDDIWSVQLRLDTQNLGAVQATVTLVDNDVKVIFRAERQQSWQLLEDNIEILITSLDKLGVTSSHLSCVCGTVTNATVIDEHQIKLTSGVDVSI